MISDVLNEVVESNKHTCPAHTGAERQQENNTLLDSLKFNLIIKLQSLENFQWLTSPAVDHYGGVVVPVGSDSFDKLNESAARLWDAMVWPRCVVEVTNQNVVPVLHRPIRTRKKARWTYFNCIGNSQYIFLRCRKKNRHSSIKATLLKCWSTPLRGLLLR